MLICWAVLGGFVLDAIFGDPAWLPHPVVLMGKAITALEKCLRAQFPQTPQGELCGGAVLAAMGLLVLGGLFAGKYRAIFLATVLQAREESETDN